MSGPLLSDHLLDLASEVGRIRSRVEPELEYMVDRLAGRILNMYLAVTPPAAVIAAETYPGDEETVVEAIRIVDERMAILLRRLGGTK